MLYHPVENLIDIESRRSTKDVEIVQKKLLNRQKPIHGPRDAMFLLSQKPSIGSPCE